ncbi:pentatricopeptide repeat-containing protein At1g50270-like [Dendrobium catenatum]|uniref:pentatricopeptide repeat-containing protein At1g50270-like n=1 Tax=Dendrobium catenatum TaxID=906689 RepID=UPI00109F4D14|nr:pentatricopeptide repeat-containing protein At1g50270-like [Dendrobium catenatum]
MKDSLHAFEDISVPDLISWNSMVQAHLNNEEFEQALILFIEMKHLGFVPDKFSFVAALEASAALPCCKTGRQIHCNLIKAGLLPLDAFTGSSLIDMYAKSMAVEDAKKVFDRINIKDLITWTLIFVGFAQNGYLNEVLRFITLMKEESKEPDNFTFASILTACANDTAIEQEKQIHALILKSDFMVDTALTNALITMCCRTGSIKDAKKVFSAIHEKNVVSWISMISGYTQCGYCKEALNLFDQMESEGTIPNAKTFIALLTACNHGGLSNDAIMYFEIMQLRHGIKPSFDHFACMVDILG